MEIIAFLIGFLLFCMALLALPVELRFSLEKEKALEYRAELLWLFGLVCVDMTKKGKKPKRRVPPKKPKRAKPHIAIALEDKGVVRRSVRLVRQLLRSLRIKELSVHGRIGLGDPAQTGMLFGVLNPLLLRSEHITLKADFEEAVFEGSCKARIRIFPLLVIVYLLAFILSPPTLRAVKSSLRNGQ